MAHLHAPLSAVQYKKLKRARRADVCARDDDSVSIQRFPSPTLIGRAGLPARPWPMKGRGGCGGSRPLGEPPSAATPGNDRPPSLVRKSLRISTAFNHPGTKNDPPDQNRLARCRNPSPHGRLLIGCGAKSNWRHPGTPASKTSPCMYNSNSLETKTEFSRVDTVSTVWKPQPFQPITDCLGL